MGLIDRVELWYDGKRVRWWSWHDFRVSLYHVKNWLDYDRDRAHPKAVSITI